MTITPHPVREYTAMPVDPDHEPVSLDDMGLSERARVALQRVHLTDSLQLASKSEDDLLEIPGLAVRGAREVRSKLMALGIQLTGNAIDNEVDEDFPADLGEDDVVWRAVKRPNVREGHTVSTDGRVKSPSGKELQRQVSVQPQVALRRTDKDQSMGVRVAILVLEAFVCAQPKNKDVFYKDGNPDNCHLSNLRWESKDHPDFKARRSIASAKSAATRAANKRSGKRSKAPVAVPRTEVLIEHTYRFGKVSITVNSDNLSGWPEGLATPQDRADALKVLAQINEMDRVMGLI